CPASQSTYLRALPPVVFRNDLRKHRNLVSSCICISSLPQKERGRTWPPPLNEQDLSALGCDASGDLVEGRVRDLVVLHLRSSLNHLREGLLHFRIGCAAVSFRILFLIPEADPDCFQSPRGDQGDCVLEAFLFSQHGNDFVLKGPGKLRPVVWFQTHGHTSTKHINLLGCRLRPTIADKLT